MKPPKLTEGSGNVEVGMWSGGVNSMTVPWALQANQSAWMQNATNRGGIVQTRPGRGLRLIVPGTNAQGMEAIRVDKTVAQPNGVQVKLSIDYLVIACSGRVFAVPFNPDGTVSQPLDWTPYQLNISFNPDAPMVYMKVGRRNLNITDEGISLVTPYNVMLLQDGVTTADGGLGPAFFDGELSGHFIAPANLDAGTENPGFEPPVATWMEFSGNRMWYAVGSRVTHSDYGDPFSMRDRVAGEGRGDFTFTSDVTGLKDYVQSVGRSVLIVFTLDSRSMLQSGVKDQVLWPTVENFQATLDNELGCVSGRSITFQAGLMWWFSQNGLVCSDPAAAQYQTTSVPERDLEMVKILSGMPEDLSGICAMAHANFLLVSVPYLDRLNSQTMVLDFADKGDGAWSGSWSGIRPVQWVRATIGTTKRLFSLSVDYQALGDGGFVHVWEEMIPEQNDTYFRIEPDGTLTEYRRRIYGQMETGTIGGDMSLKEFSYAEMDYGRVGGEVDIKFSYRGMRGAYRACGSRKWRALTFDFQYSGDKALSEQVAKAGDLTAQWRRAKTDTVNRTTEPVCCGSNLPANVDRGFSLLIEWCGQLAVQSINMIFVAYAEANVGEPSTQENELCGQSSAGDILRSSLPPQGAQDTPPASFAASYVATRSFTAVVQCPNQSVTQGIQAVATVSYRSYVSQADAESAALAEATARAQAAAAQYQAQNPCTWASLRYASRTCYPNLNDVVNDVALRSDGNFILTGPFTLDGATVQRQFSKRVADGYIDPSFGGMNFNLDEPPTKIVALGSALPGVVMVFGPFLEIGAPESITLCGGVITLDINGALLNASDPDGLAPGETILDAVAYGTTQALAAGRFTQLADGTGLVGLVRLNSNCSLDGSFSPNIVGQVITGCAGVAASGTGIFAALEYDGNADVHVVKLLPNGSVDGSFAEFVVTGAAGNSEGVKLSVSSGKLYVGFQKTIRRLNANGTVDSGYDPAPLQAAIDGTPGMTAMIALTTGEVMVALSSIEQVVKKMTSAGLVTDWALTVPPNGRVEKIVQAGAQVALAGDFTLINGFNASRFSLIGIADATPVFIYRYAVKNATAESEAGQGAADSLAAAQAAQALNLELVCP